VNPFEHHDTFGNLDVGDTRDDDARVLQSLTEEIQAPPTPLQTHIVTPDLMLPKPPSMLITHTALLTSAGGPQQLLQPDPNRVALYLRVTSSNATVTDYVLVADDDGKVQQLGTSANFYAQLFHGAEVEFTPHTGSVWVSALGSANPITIVAIAVSQGVSRG
jgi:hypothetical protein